MTKFQMDFLSYQEPQHFRVIIIYKETEIKSTAMNITRHKLHRKFLYSPLLFCKCTYFITIIKQSWLIADC